MQHSPQWFKSPYVQHFFKGGDLGPALGDGGTGLLSED